MKTYKREQFDFATALAVVSSAQKFVIPVPAFADGGEPLVYPEWHAKAGTPVVNYKGEPLGERGIVFNNPTDKVVQAAVGDGSKIIIVNKVTREQADLIEQKVLGLNADPSQLTLEQLKEVLAWLFENGMRDFYDSDQGFCKKNLTRVGAAPQSETGSDIPFFGLHKRDDRDTCYAFRVAGPCTVAGAAAEPTPFDTEGVALKHGDSFRAIQLAEFLETYQLPSGQRLTADVIPLFEAAE